MRSFLTRLLVAVIAIPTLVFIFHRGGEWMRVLVALLLTLGAVEVQRLSSKAGATFSPIALVILCLLTPWLAGHYWQGLTWPVWIAAVVIVAAIPVVWGREIRSMASSSAALMAAALWIGIGFGSLLGLREVRDGNGFWWLILLFSNLWAGDTAAYLFGVWLGEKKLAPRISPKKTVAGAVAQVVASGVVGSVFAVAAWFPASAAELVAASLLIGVIGQIGDLFESVLKRAAGEKDSSMLIPGHGGILDRFDSTLLAAPSLYILLMVWPR
jgi:phosphatidate cytidylyltransferase